MVTHPRSYADA